jgi:hypothetical protein
MNLTSLLDNSQPLPWEANGHGEAPLHSIVSRIGSFPPRMARFFIGALTNPGDLVADPFCGKGTALLEALLQDRLAVGCDVAPDAAVISAAKADPVTTDELDEYLRDGPHPPQKPACRTTPEMRERLDVFFHPITLRQIVKVRDWLIADAASLHPETRRLATYAQATVLGILHGKSRLSLSVRCSHSYSMAPNYVRNYLAASASRGKPLVPPVRNVIECMGGWAKRTSLTADEVARIRGKGVAHCCDAAALRSAGLYDNRCTLVITSPPYLAAQTYMKDNWIRLWFLGHDWRQLRHRSYLETADVGKYERGMTPIMDMIGRVLTPGGHCVMVVGDVKKKRVRRGCEYVEIINLAQVLQPIAATCGLETLGTVEDTIPNLRKQTRTYAKEGIAKDRLLVLRRPQ